MTPGVPHIGWFVLLIVVVAAIVGLSVRYLRARPVMTGYLRAGPRDGEGVDVRLQNRMRVRRDLGTGILEVSGFRDAGTVKLRLVWTPAAGGKPAAKEMPRGGTVIFSSVTFSHVAGV